MQEKDVVCLQCQKTPSIPSNRLVQDSCGHKKCRSCLLDDIESCKQCLMSFDTFKDGDKNISDNAENLPRITDNHTAVIHCNGRARLNSDTITLDDEMKVESLINLKEQENDSNKSEISKREVDKAKSKEKSAQKKKISEIPAHITVKSDPVCYLCTICKKTFVTKSHIEYHKYCTGGKFIYYY